MNSISTTCAGCSSTDLSHAADGDFSTYSQANYSATGSGGFSIRATAQAGIAFPSGSQPGAVINFQSANPSSNPNPTNVTFGVSVSTYLSGSKQETLSSNTVGTPNDDAVHVMAGTATKPFDAVEVTFSRASPGPAQTFWVYEFCSDRATQDF